MASKNKHLKTRVSEFEAERLDNVVEVWKNFFLLFLSLIVSLSLEISLFENESLCIT